MAQALMALLVVALIYALALVLLNGNQVAVNLLFTQIPLMNLGLLLILCLAIGVLIGGLLAVLLFRVVQNKREIARLSNENARLKAQAGAALNNNNGANIL